MYPESLPKPSGNKVLDGFLFFRHPLRMKPEVIDKQTRCPRLGHEIAFSYCLKEAGDLPCPRAISCWAAVFDIETFLKEELAPGKWEEFINQKANDKITTLMEVIEKAKKRI